MGDVGWIRDALWQVIGAYAPFIGAIAGTSWVVSWISERMGAHDDSLAQVMRWLVAVLLGLGSPDALATPIRDFGQYCFEAIEYVALEE